MPMLGCCGGQANGASCPEVANAAPPVKDAAALALDAAMNDQYSSHKPGYRFADDSSTVCSWSATASMPVLKPRSVRQRS
jgi:hypothetical protein